MERIPAAARGHVRKAVPIDALLRDLLDLPVELCNEHAIRDGGAALTKAATITKQRTGLLTMRR